MTESFEIPLLATEALISLDAAMAAAEQMASHGIAESGNFESLMTILQDAASAVDQIKRISGLEDNVLATSRLTNSRVSRQEASLQVIPRSANLVKSTSVTPPALRLISAEEH